MLALTYGMATALANVDSAQTMKEAEGIEEPEDHGDDDHAIEDRLDVALHGDETIHQPKQNADHDERDNKIDKRHTILHFPETHWLESDLATHAPG